MISGDHIETAIVCAKNAGILEEGEQNAEFRCMTGTEFREAFGGVKAIFDKDGNPVLDA